MKVRALPFAAGIALFVACQAPPPPPPQPAPAPSAPVEAKAIGTVRVTASALNVRAEASSNAEVIGQVKRGEKLTLLDESESWSKVKLASGETGWAASRFLEREGEKKTASKKRGGSCPADSDFAFATTPMPNLSDSKSHGLVVIDANVDVKGNVTSTKVVQNTTGDESLAFLTEREIKSAKFIPPVRNCAAKAFIFTYKRTF